MMKKPLPIDEPARVKAGGGRPYPLGATCDRSGVNFALYSGDAGRVELCLFDPSGRETRIEIHDCTEGVWHAYVPGLAPGQYYGYRVHGPYAPQEGLRFNPAKLLLDPYARAFSGPIPADERLPGFDPADAERPDPRDSAEVMPRCVVTDDPFDWGEDRSPRTAWERSVIYEAHVKGLTRRHPQVPPACRGKYLGLAAPAVIDHLLQLGVTAIELLPVQYFATEPRLAGLGLENYWGYNTIGFFAPDARYATRPETAIEEFRTMVKALHAAGIEVILDVVYNHTAEGNHRGPTLSFRGIDNQAYYLLDPDSPAHYLNFSACGNTLNTLHPRTQQLIMDSLRYWVSQMHVDGFRFDLAPALCRESDAVDEHLRFFGMVQQDPTLAGAKLIVEPWDAGTNGRWLGRFPAGVAEWNGRYRDCVRRFWRGDAGQLAELTSRVAGSSDLFALRKGPLGGVNYVTCHDGMTLHDLVSYGEKHNQANAEDNQDGPPDDFSCNYGIEGPTDDSQIIALRERMKRNFLATLAFSQGVMMLTAGDEIGRTQKGNNNAYCQDNELSWVDWKLETADSALLSFARRVIALRHEHPIFRRKDYFDGEIGHPLGIKDVAWLDEWGREITGDAWHDARRMTLAMLMHAGAARPGELDENHVELLLLLFNSLEEECCFVLPNSGEWRELINTCEPSGGRVVKGSVTLAAKSMALLECSGAA